MSTSKQTNKVAPFSLKLKQYISKLLTEGMEPDEIVKDLGLPEESVQNVVKLKFMNEKRMEFKKVAAHWKNVTVADKKNETKPPPVDDETAVKKVEVKKKGKALKKSDDQKKKGLSVEKKMVKKVEKAMVEWLKSGKDELTLYNILEKAEMLSNEVFTDKNYQRRGFKVTEGWFRDFRKRNGLKIRYAEEIEKYEAKKLAKKLETVVPDFVWGECAGCDGTDCPVHEWISSKPIKKKEDQTKSKSLSETIPTSTVTTKPEISSKTESSNIQPVVSIQNPVEMMQPMLSIQRQPKISIAIQSNPVSTIQPIISSTQLQYSLPSAIPGLSFCDSIQSAQIKVSPQLAMSSVQSFQTPILSVQPQASVLRPSNTVQFQNGGSTVQCFQSPILSVQTPQTSNAAKVENEGPIVNGNYDNVQSAPMETIGDFIDLSHHSESDSDSSALVIAGEEDEEMDESVVKTEEPTITYMNVEQDDGKPGKELGDLGGGYDLDLRKKKVKEAFDLFVRGLSLLEEYDLFAQRRKTFCDGLHKLLDLYQLPEQV